jgi:chromosomal replication initiator protein
MSEFAIKLESPSDYKEIWKECLKIIKENVPNLTYNTWFLPIKPLSLEGSRLKIQVPNSFFIEWIDERYNLLINKMVKSVLGENGELVYVVMDENEPEEQNDNFTEKIQTVKPVKSTNEENTDTPSETIDKEPVISNLNPRYTFDNFIKGDNNQLARAAGIAISDNPGHTSFNPLFIYGGVGLGKTHLMQAIGNEILKKDSAKKVIYLSADIFTVEFVEAIQTDSVNEFAGRYKKMDVLIIDDIQFLIGREKTQDLFFQIFNMLHQSGKQIILSSDKPPKELKGLSERLVSRFQWGLTTDIQPPDLETRIAILRNKSASYGIELSHEIIEYIAFNITSNIRELEGCLIKLLANASLSEREIDFELVKKTVKEIATNRPANISIDQITKVVCEFFEVDENKVREKNRKKEVVQARQVAMYLAKKLTNSSLKTIGLHFGGRDHSTVIHAQNSIEEAINTDENMKEIIKNLRNKIEYSV